MAELKSPRLQAALLLLGMILLLAAGVGASGRISSSMEQLAASARRASDQADVAEEILFALQRAESGQRGFLLTGDPAYLGPYEQVRAGLGRLFGKLETLAQGTPWLQAETTALREVATRKMDELGTTIGLMQSQGRDAALALVRTDRGRVEMESAREIANRITRRASTERDAGAAALQRREGTLEIATGAGLVIGVVLLAVAGLSLIRSRAALLLAREGERREAERMQSAVEHLRDGVAVFDAAGSLTLQNSRFAPTLGLAQGRLPPGTTLASLAASVALEPPALANPAPGAGAEVTEARQGARVLELWRSAMPRSGQMVTVADVTRRVEAEAIARQAQKMDVIGQMTGGIAHDFNNLLQVISANLEMSIDRLEQSESDPVVLNRLEAASNGVARGARLTRQLLAFARRQKLIPEAIEPARLLLGLEDMLRRTLGEAVELRLVVGAALWTMRADPTQLESALLNLTVNARDAMMRDGEVSSGQVTIEAANVALDDTCPSTTEAVAPGDYVMFGVSDTGIGMSEEQLARALEPFYTTKPEGKGTGLGLSMVFGFAKQSGGHFQLSSQPGRGTTARLYIPRTTETVGVAAEPTPRAPESAGELVLLVEDDPEVRRAAVGSIRSLGYTVYEAGNGDRALALLDEGLRPALLFTDVVMPGAISSRELVAKARAMVPGLAVLFTSGYGREKLGWEEEFGRSLHLLHKPWRTEQLAEALRAALDSARHPAGDQAPRRVLLVEDEGLVRMTTADVLGDLGFEVIEAESGAAALARLEPAPDLLITDLGLPDMDGTALIAQVRARLPGLPVVVASGRTEKPEGDAVYLIKPYDGRDLRTAVNAALRKALAGSPVAV